MPNDAVQTFIRTSDPTIGFVLCPENAFMIDGVTAGKNSFLLRISNFAIPGGVPAPFCDSNTVFLGTPPSGTYSVTASIVLSNGTVLPPFVSAVLGIGVPTMQPIGIPVSGAPALFVVVLLVGLWGVRRLSG